MRYAILLLALVAALGSQAADQPDWASHMQEVHAKYKGKPGVVAQWGDSITFTMAFWCPLNYGHKYVPAELADTEKWLPKYVAKQCWRDWKGPEYGNNSGTTADWGLKGADGWLAKENPEVALIMWGTNDTKGKLPKEKYKAIIAGIVDKALANGTIPVLYTIPPRVSQTTDAAMATVVESYVAAVREIATEKKVPLIDFYKEIMDRQPKDFGKTLMGDELHPSYPDGHQNSFDDESLKLSGYTLRNFLTLKMFNDLRGAVLK